MHAHTRHIAARPTEAGDKSCPDRVTASHEHNRNVRSRGLRRLRRSIAATSNKHGHLLIEQVSHKRGQAIISTFGWSVFDR